MSFGFSSSFQPRQPRRWWCPTGPGSLRDMDVSGQRRPPVSLPDHSGEVITARGCIWVSSKVICLARVTVTAPRHAAV
jgi:hypothetical protein